MKQLRRELKIDGCDVDIDIEQQLAENAVEAICQYMPAVLARSKDLRKYMTTQIVCAILQGQIEYMKQGEGK